MAQDFDLTQMDLTDPETRKYAESQLDMSDPETKKYFDQFAPGPAGDVDPLAGYTQGRTGEAPVETSTWDRRLKEAQGERPGLDSDNNLGHTYGPADVAARGVEYGMAANNTILEGMDDLAEKSGMADLPSAFGIDQKLLPGSMIGAIQEAFPLGGMEGGLLPNGTGVRNLRDGRAMEAGRVPAGQEIPKTLSPEVEAGLEQLYQKGTKEDILKYTQENGIKLGEGLDEYLESRDAGRPGDSTVRYDQEGQGELDLHQEPRQMEMDFSPPKTLEETLSQEAADFRRSKSPEPGPESLFKEGEQLSMDLPEPKGQTSFHFDAPDEAPALPKKAAEVDEHVNGLIDEINNTAEGWKNSPSFEVVRSVADVTDPRLLESIQAEGIKPKAVVTPEGKVIVFADNVAKHEVRPMVFHEALGHHGMTQVFKDGLDAKLEGIYNGSEWFRGKVDDWRAKNPGAYDGSIARAADEVFAGMSEDGPRGTKMHEVILNQMKNVIKDTARKMGINLKYSPREIESILDMAHDATMNGSEASAANAYGYRFMVSRDKAGKESFETGKPVEVEGVHGTYSGWDDFDPAMRGETTGTSSAKNAFWFATKDRTAKYYSRIATKEKNTWSMPGEKREPAVLNRKISFKNPLVVDMKNKVYREESFNSIVERAKAEGHDGVVLKNAFDAGEYSKIHAVLDGKFKGETLYGVFDSEQISKNNSPTNRYMRGDTKKSVNGSKMETKRDLDDLLKFIGQETEGLQKGPTSVVETARAADDMNLTASKLLRSKSLADQNISAMVHGAKQLLTDQAEGLAKLHDRAVKEGLTPTINSMIREKLATTKAVYARFNEDIGELGRAFRQLREITSSRELGREANRFMGETDGVAILGDEEATMRFLKNMKELHEKVGPAAAVEHAKAVQKAHVEDYLGSVIYNMMLSSPKTWAFNFVGSPLNMIMDLGADIPRAVTPSGRAEIAARVHGHLAALSNADTWKATFDSFKEGRSDGIGMEGKTGQKDLILSSSKNPLVKGAGMVVETPQRVMAATDQFWSKVAHMGNMYGEAAREATLETNSKAAYAQKFADYLETPTAEMKARAEQMTNRQLFRDHDAMSKGARKLTENMKPRYEDAIEVLMKEVTDEDGKIRMTPIAKSVKDKNTAGERAIKFGTRLAIPFVPTVDSIARTIVRNSGPGALFSKAIRDDIMAGGVRRQSALGRIGVSTAVMSTMWALAKEGKLTGLGDPDYKKQETLQATKPPMSVKIGDTWYSYRGFDPLAGQLAAMATAYERGGDKGLSPEALGGFISGTAAGLANSSYAEPVVKFAKMFGEGAETVLKGEKPGPALVNFIGGNIGTVTNPAFLRWLDTQLGDGIKKDTTGDDSVGDKILGRAMDHNMILDALAEKENPSKHDVYGRPIKDSLSFGLMSTKGEETSPAILELDRLEGTTDKIVVGAVGVTAKVNGEANTRLTAEQYQEYQKQTGQLLVQSMEQIVADPEYQSLTDEEKVEIVHELRDEIREEVRSELFPDPEEEGED